MKIKIITAKLETLIIKQLGEIRKWDREIQAPLEE